ncbi:MAG: thioredoxin [Treponema sp.]|nr:thioredoxin [Treponema sp.]
MKEITITSQNYETEVIKSEKPVLLDFWAPWCGPCKMLGPVVSEIAEEHDEIKVGKVNVDDEEELAEQFGIMSIPTLVLMKDGKVANTFTGFAPKETLENFIKL